ncbi:hypothetical protein BW722_00495 [Lawsonia intracellularis]|nr:hypothetical protein BW722_00495 [Lawsonia intracellularis]
MLSVIELLDSKKLWKKFIVRNQGFFLVTIKKIFKNFILIITNYAYISYDKEKLNNITYKYYKKCL